ncbi:MAG: PAS domain-containing protein [Alphaproteobacteria bacterium]|nr:PAS domain-containing protein [Alphaproteobacteria bacterium]
MSMVSQRDPHFNRLYITAFILALGLALSVLVVLQFAQGQFQRDIENWQIRLSLIADSRLNDVDGWLEAQFGELQNIAQNTSVRRFVGSNTTADDAMGIDTPTQEVYLRHLLTISAQRSGFSAPLANNPLNENPMVNSGGIAVLNMQGEVRIATPNMPPLQGKLAEFVDSATPAESNMMDMISNADGADLRMGFLLPIYDVQSVDQTSAQVGWVMGVKQVDDSLFNLLRHPGVIEASLETVLLRPENGGVSYLSPLADGTKPVRKHLAMPDSLMSDGSLAAAFAVQEPGQFGIYTDYRQNKVLVTGRKVPGTNWWVMTKVDENEALGDAVATRNALIALLLLVVAVVFAVIIAAWRHGTSRDASRLAARLDAALKKAKIREDMLALVTNTQPSSIFIVNGAEIVCFANDAFAERVKLSQQEVLGKKLEGLLGPVTAMEYERASTAALQDEKTIIWTHRERVEGVEHITRVKHIPLNHLPMSNVPVGTKGVLVLEQDITAVVTEREKRARTLRDLVDTLVAMVDRRDPYAANHSLMVATLSREVAQGMELEAPMISTAEIAGTVMNIGKMEVPAEWLTKPGALNEQERKAIRDSLLESANLLEGVEFDGPVTDTLRQSLEHWDGSGPQKMNGEDILITARIVSAANAFIGMVSPRSYRKAMPVDDALEILMKAREKEFDRKVVVALANYIDNHGGRDMIANLIKKPDNKN